jgi:Tfp pilus assembly protein PilF
MGSLQATHYKKYKEAQANFEKAIQLDSSEAEAHFHLGLLLIEKFGERKQGESELRKAYQLDASNEEIKKSFERYCR